MTFITSGKFQLVHTEFLGLYISLYSDNQAKKVKKPFILDLSLTWIDREDLGESHTGARQGQMISHYHS